MRWAPIAACLFLAACPFDPQGRNPIVADDVPIEIDAAVDAVDAFVCACPLGCRGDNSCADYAPSNPGDFPLLAGATAGLTLPDGNYTFDSDALTITGPGGLVSTAGLVSQVEGGAWLLGVTSLTIPAAANVRGVGDRPIKILSAGDVTIAGVFDVSGGCGAGRGPWCGGPGGGDGGHAMPASVALVAATGCGPGGTGLGSTAIPEAGGGGGAFGTGGGAGGDGSGVTSTTTGGAGGLVCANTPALVPLGGGGGGGGAGYVFNTTDGRTSGGGGGGALQISGLTTIAVSGVLRASGAGGNASAVGDDGGGGGGAGGGILLEAPSIQLAGTARIVANGGGGGAGVDAGPARNGESGRDDRVRAAGGDNLDTTGGGFGAIGAVAGQDATAGDPARDGGSGGGGGGGTIRINSFQAPTVAAIVSPTASLGSITPR